MAVERSRTRRVTYGQLEVLWEALNQNRSLATGYNKTARARDNLKKMWEIVAQNLNSFGDGAMKDGKSWCKYWNDYKSKLKHRVAAIHTSQHRTGGGPSTAKPLSEIEEKFLQLLGDGFGTGLPGVRVEPFEVVATISDEVIDFADIDAAYSIESQPSESILNRDASMIVDIRTISPQPGPSTRPDPEVDTIDQPPNTIQHPSTPPPVPHRTHYITPHPSPHRSPRRTPHTSPQTRQRTPRQILPQRRRAHRREPLMTMEAARRSLVTTSQLRAELSQRKTVALERLVEELRELKHIIVTRLPVSPTNVG